MSAGAPHGGRGGGPPPAGGLTRAQRAAAALRLDADWTLVLCGAGLGIAIAFAALGFILPIRWAERALEHALLGAIGTVIVYALLPMTARGHGVTQVLYAVHRMNSRLPAKLAVRQWLAATLTIVSGGSAGPEGPIVTIGATIGSNAARVVGRPSPGVTSTLLGCGAAAGLSAASSWGRSAART